MLTRHGETETERTDLAVDPAAIIRALGAVTPALDTGFLPPDVVWVQKRTSQITVASYRPPQITGIWLEGVDYALHTPMPGLLLIHTAATRSSRLFALTEAPTGENTPLFAAPLPNTSEHQGSVCWGSVPIPDLDSPNDLTPIWRTLLGSAFINHSVSGKSKKHSDIRALLVELHEQQAAAYPLDDLLPAQSHKTLKQAFAIGTYP